MNADWVADGIWSSIHNPVNEDMIRTGVLTEEMVEERPIYYANKKAAKRDNFIVRKMNSFHNIYIKSELLLQKTLRKGDSILDLACGRGGDIKKWVMNKAGWVMGIDYNLDNLITTKEGIYGRYLDMKIINKGDIPPMVFVQADSTRNIKDGSGSMTDYDKNLLSALYDNGPKVEAPPAVETLRGFANRGFDVVSCMFAIHYMFKDRQSVDGFLTNIADNLKIGGYFIGCCFDGDSVHKLLTGLPEGGIKVGKEKDTDIWSIRRSYTASVEDNLPASDEGLGKAIDVFYYSIGEEHREFLVSFDYLTRRMEEIGCELLNPSELNILGLNKSSNLFSESYKMTGKNYTMSKTLQEFSFLNRWFIFRRRNAGTVTKKPELLREKTQQGGNVGSIFKFFHNAIMNDNMKIGRNDWARYISPSTHSRLHDIEDPSIIYPSLDAAFASTLYKIGTDKPELGPTLFSVNSNIHQTYIKGAQGANEDRKADLKDDEIAAIRNQIKPAEIKRTGAKFNAAKYLEEREQIMQSYIRQRYDTDPEFRRIIEAIKAKNGTLVYYNGPRPNEMGGIVRPNGSIDGENMLGKMYMSL
jgi:SAM-dependent methyltransferase